MAKDPNKKKKGRNPKSVVTALLFLASIFATPSAVVVSVGLIPTYAAWLMDREQAKLTAITVGALNLAAITPLLINLWNVGHTLGNAQQILMSPFSWLVILAGAGVGWFLAQTIPALIVMVISGKNKLRLDRIRARQKQLVDEWGNAVTENGS